MLKCKSEPMNFPLSVSPSKEMGDRMRQRKTSPTSAGIEPTTSGFDRPLLYRQSHEARWEQGSNANVKGKMNIVPPALMTQFQVQVPSLFLPPVKVYSMLKWGACNQVHALSFSPQLE